MRKDSQGFYLAPVQDHKDLRINQKGRAEIDRRIEKEERQGVRLRKLGWEIQEERERNTRDIKRSLFSSSMAVDPICVSESIEKQQGGEQHSGKWSELTENQQGGI
jgi:hypothetical protein